MRKVARQSAPGIMNADCAPGRFTCALCGLPKDTLYYTINLLLKQQVIFSKSEKPMSIFFARPFSRIHGRRAFTLVELLVVIAIIGVLVALLLPAIQAAREAARRVQCQNTLHNLAIAVLNYENQRKALPQALDAPLDPSNANRIGSVKDGGTRLSWIVRILPFIEQAQLYDQFDMKLNIANQTNQETASDATRGPQSSQINFLMCPSDQAQNRFFVSTPFMGAGNKVYGKGNYAAYVAPEHIECLPLARGALIHEPQRLGRIEDGTSNTLMLGEIRTRDDDKDLRGAWALAWPGASMLALDMHAAGALTRICAQANPPAYVPNTQYKDFVLTPNSERNSVGADLADDLFLCDSGTTAVNSKLEKMPCVNTANNQMIAAARSNHPGGVNNSHIDGSVRWIGDDIEQVLYGSLACVHDGLTLRE
jgi:prepilin-type N-terminal cleavage/methylation domain-containing protein